jgi:hypothetical protein
MTCMTCHDEAELQHGLGLGGEVVVDLLGEAR